MRRRDMKTISISNVMKFSKFNKILLAVDIGLLTFIYIKDWGVSNYQYKIGATLLFLISLWLQIKKDGAKSK